MFNQKRRTAALSILIMATIFAATPLAAQILDDPMRPPSETTTTGGKGAKKITGYGNGFHLSAIRISKDKRSATVNGKTLAVGDRIANARVISIQASSVTLQQNGKNLTINLLPLSIKKPVEATRP